MGLEKKPHIKPASDTASREPFVTGLPGPVDEFKPKDRPITKIIDDAIRAKRNAIYDKPGTPESKARDNRIMGERED